MRAEGTAWPSMARSASNSSCAAASDFRTNFWASASPSREDAADLLGDEPWGSEIESLAEEDAAEEDAAEEDAAEEDAADLLGDEPWGSEIESLAEAMGQGLVSKKNEKRFCLAEGTSAGTRRLGDVQGSRFTASVGLRPRVL